MEPYPPNVNRGDNILIHMCAEISSKMWEIVRAYEPTSHMSVDYRAFSDQTATEVKPQLFKLGYYHINLY